MSIAMTKMTEDEFASMFSRSIHATWEEPTYFPSIHQTGKNFFRDLEKAGYKILKDGSNEDLH
jgi:hypothetical protein